MDKSFATGQWLDWLTRVRLLTITLILTVGVVWPQYVPGYSTNRFFLPLIIFWITLGILHLILLRWLPQARWHRSEEHTSELQSLRHLVCRLLLEKKKSTVTVPIRAVGASSSTSAATLLGPTVS